MPSYLSQVLSPLHWFKCLETERAFVHGDKKNCNFVNNNNDLNIFIRLNVNVTTCSFLHRGYHNIILRFGRIYSERKKKQLCKEMEHFGESGNYFKRRLTEPL